MTGTEPAGTGQPLRILLVDDSGYDADLVEGALRDGGLLAETRIVATAADFRAALLGFSPNVILADWAMPGFSGAGAVATAREWDATVPCILVSGALGEELVVEALRTGATDYVLKQRLQALVPAIRRAVDEAKEHRERLRLESELAANQTAMRDALDAMADPFVILSTVQDRAGAICGFRVAFANRAAGVFLGRSSSTLIGTSMPEPMPHLRGRPHLDVFREIMESGGRWTEDGVEFLVHDPEGPVTSRVVDIEIAALGNGVFVVWRDVTERHQAEFEMRRLATAIEQAAEAVVITDAAGQIEYVNPAFEQASGYTRDEAMGRNPRFLKSGVQDASFYTAMWSTLASGSSFVGDMTNRRKDGTLYQEESVISPVRDRDDFITSYVAVKRNVTRERALEATQERIARERAVIVGTLASLSIQPSPAGTAELICRQVASLAGVASASLGYFTLGGPVMSLAFIRADGEPVGLRRLPKQRSRILRERSEAGPWVESWGHRRWHPYDKLHAELGTKALAYAPVRHGATLVGLLTVASSADDAISALTESLPALLEFAGVAGALIGPALQELTELGAIRTSIAEIIRAGAFRPVFQPIVDLETGVPAGYEALTRFLNGTAPALVFADARASGLEAELELATVASAIAASAGLPPDAWVSLNVSPELVTRDERFAKLLRPVDRPLVLEVTEHVPVIDYPATLAAIGRLRPSVRIAIDDAGAGIANFSHIVELRPAFVKLDIGLVRGIDTDLGRQALMVGLVHFATASASQTIAEGVETAAELAMLLKLGVPLGQGSLLGRPAPAADWMRWAAHREDA